MKLKPLFILLLLHLLAVQSACSQVINKAKRLDSISVIFKFGSADIENPQRLIFRSNQVRGNIGRIVIVSYTDTVGSQKENRKLADKRMRAVSEMVRTTKLGAFTFDSVNKNEQRGGKKLTDSLFRRVDVLVYSNELQLVYNTPLNLDINFQSETDIIVKNSMDNLNTLFLIMQQDTSIRIQLNGHVCCRPGQELSVQRAERVKKHLISKGIKSSRISCKGFSNTMPLVSEANIEDRVKNMRVEVVFRK